MSDTTETDDDEFVTAKLCFTVKDGAPFVRTEELLFLARHQVQACSEGADWVEAESPEHASGARQVIEEFERLLEAVEFGAIAMYDRANSGWRGRLRRFLRRPWVPVLLRVLMALDLVFLGWVLGWFYS